jgi:hypothetical protein
MYKSTRTILTVLGVLLSASVARAQATRTWVSGVGDDANPCSRTAPCKTFAGAISKTASGGEINALDNGGFGAVTITKSVTISTEPQLGGVLAALTNGVIINPSAAAPNTVVVTLRNLDINGAGNGLNGIRFLHGAALHVEHCTIYGFTGKGIDAQPNAAAKLYVSDTIIRDAVGGAILLKPVSPATLRASFDNVRLENSGFGLRAEDNTEVTMSHSVVSGNFANGVVAFSGLGGPVNIMLYHNVSSGNGSNGINASGANTFIRLSEVAITRNATGMTSSGGGAIVSFGNNYNEGNTTADGSPTSTISPQ